MSTTEGKSKRDLIWERKKRAREQLLQNAQNQDNTNNNPAPNFAKKSPLLDNVHSELPQQSKPLDIYDTNRGRRVQFQNEEESKPISQPSNNQAYQTRDYPQEQFSQEPPQEIPSRNNQHQPNYSDYEPKMNNRNQSQNVNFEEPAKGQKVNFNPTFQPSVEHYEPLVGRESRDLNNGKFEDKKKKYDYAEDLRNQMRQKEMKKQQEKNEIRSSYQGNNNDDAYMREVEKKRKEQYGDFLKQQMQAKEESKKLEKQVDRKAQLIQSLESQDYNPYGRGGAGAPLHQNGQKNDLLNNFPDQRNMNQPAYIPQQRQPGYPPQQQMGSIPQIDIYQPQRMQQQQQQQPIYNNPAPEQSHQIASTNEKYLPRQGSLDMRVEKFTPGNQLPRSGTMEYDADDGGSMENIDQGNYARGNMFETKERVGRRGLPLQSEDPQALAKKDKLKQDFQKGLQEQIEFKKKQKELERQRKLEEDRLEDERIRRENEEFERRQAEEDPKKRKVRPPVEQEPNQFVVQAKERPNRNRQGNAEQNNQPNSSAYPNPPNDILNQPPPYYNPPYGQNPPQQQQPYPYPPPYNQAYNPLYPPPYNHPYPPQYHHPYPGHPGPYGQPLPQTPPFYNPQQPASYPSGQRTEVTSELQQIRSEIQNQQAVLSKQLELIKKEAMNVMEGRDKAEKELLELRGKLKEKMVHDQLYQQNLQNAIDRNIKTRPPQRVQELPIKATYQGTNNNPSFDPYPIQENPKRQQLSSQNQYENKYEDFHEISNLDQPNYDIRRTDKNLLNVPHNKFEDSYSPYLDHDRTLAGDTKMIPLDVFDNKLGGGNHLRVSNQDPLTLSKIHKYDVGPSVYKQGRPNSSKQWNVRDEDSIDALIKNHGGFRPSSSESNPMGDTSHFIGKRLDEASMILKQADMTNRVKGTDRYGLKSRENDTLSLAGRNVLGEKNTNMNMRGYGHKDSLLRGDEGIRMNITGHTDILPDLSMGPGNDHYDMTDHHSMNMTGTSFNVDKINLANEARLKKLENMGTGSLRSNQGYDYPGTGGKGNYYGNHRGGLESIQEDPDDNMAKIDKILGGYIKTHEDEGQNRNSMY